MGVSQNWGYLLGGPYYEDSNGLGSTLGSPYFGKATRYRRWKRGNEWNGFDGRDQACGVKPDLVFGILFLRKLREMYIYIYVYRESLHRN